MRGGGGRSAGGKARCDVVAKGEVCDDMNDSFGLLLNRAVAPPCDCFSSLRMIRARLGRGARR